MKYFTEDLNFLNEKFEDLCTECSGLGHISDHECPACSATGYKTEGRANQTEELYENSYSRHAYDKNNPDLIICSECEGLGHTDENECTSCTATGLVLKNNKQTPFKKATLIKPKLYQINNLDFTLCTSCEGMGHIDDQECLACNASGLKPRAKMKYDLNQYSKLYRKHISFDTPYAFNRGQEKTTPSKEKQH